MEPKLQLFTILLSISLCHGQFPLFDLISTAHSTIKEVSHGVARGVVNGITKGFNLKPEGNVGLNPQMGHGTYQANNGPTNPPEKTLIVVVKDNGDSKQYNKPPGNYKPNDNENKVPFNNNYERPYNNYDQNQNKYGKGYLYNERPQYPPQYNGNNGLNNQNYGNSNNGFNPIPNYGNDYNNRPNAFDNNNQQNANEIYGNTNPGGNKFNNKPIAEYSTKEPVSLLKPIETIQKPDNDIPLFGQLLPDENTEQKNVTAPKRETDNNEKPAEEPEEEYELNIRMTP